MHTSNDVFERSTAAFLKSCSVNCLLVNWIQKTPLLSTQLKSRSQAIRNHGVTSNWLSQGEQAFTLRSMTKMYCFGFWEHRELSVLQKKVSLDRNEITGFFSDSCFVIVIAPMADLLKGAEIIIVPDFRKNQVPFAALKDEGGKKPTEPFRIRLIPSLTTLKPIQESPPGYHRQTGTQIVVDPEAGGVLYDDRRKIIPPLPCTRREANLVGRLLGVTPLIGDRAKKAGCTPNNRVSESNTYCCTWQCWKGREYFFLLIFPLTSLHKKYFLLAMFDISRIQLHVKLVVFSCCWLESRKLLESPERS